MSLVLGCCFGLGSSAFAASGTAFLRPEAAFLCRLASFVDCPPGAFSGEADPVVIGILGEDPFAGGFARRVGEGET